MPSRNTKALIEQQTARISRNKEIITLIVALIVAITTLAPRCSCLSQERSTTTSDGALPRVTIPVPIGESEGPPGQQAPAPNVVGYIVGDSSILPHIAMVARRLYRRGLNSPMLVSRSPGRYSLYFDQSYDLGLVEATATEFSLYGEPLTTPLRTSERLGNSSLTATTAPTAIYTSPSGNSSINRRIPQGSILSAFSGRISGHPSEAPGNQGWTYVASSSSLSGWVRSAELRILTRACIPVPSAIIRHVPQAQARQAQTDMLIVMSNSGETRRNPHTHSVIAYNSDSNTSYIGIYRTSQCRLLRNAPVYSVRGIIEHTALLQGRENHWIFLGARFRSNSWNTQIYNLDNPEPVFSTTTFAPRTPEAIELQQRASLFQSGIASLQRLSLSTR